MAKGNNQKLKIVYLIKIFMEKTDDEHSITMSDIISELNSYGITAERKSLYNDIESLRQYGYDIIGEQHNRTYYYYLAGRQFELAELKLLVDTVQSAKFITEKKSNELIKKVEGLTSKYGASKLQHQVYVSGRVKTNNEKIYYNVDYIHTAIDRNSMISFQYFQWNVKKEKVLKKDGKPYEVSPWALSWDDENYYMLGFDAQAGFLKHYRVDKMAGVTVLDEPRRGKEQFADLDLPAYLKKHFQMFGGPEYRVTLRCTSDLESAMRERFGASPIFVPEGKEHFHFDVPVCVSDQFYGWVCGFGGKIEVVSPAEVRDGLRALNERLVKMHQKK